jgi:hypothetical protein
MEREFGAIVSLGAGPPRIRPRGGWFTGCGCRRVDDEGDEADVAATRRTREREVFGDLRQELRPSYSGGVVGTRLFVVPGTLTPALSQRERWRRCGAGPSGRIGDGQRRDGRPEGVVRHKHPVIAVAMPSRRGHEVGEPVEELKW